MKRKEFLPYFQPSIGEEEIKEVVDVLRSGWLTMGPRVAELEAMIAKYTGAKHAICVDSCTAALHLSLLALGVGEGDEVITSPFTFAATGNVIIHVGAKPVFVDIRRDTYNINPERIEAAITPKTRAIMPVHYAGQPCEMDEISEIAERHKLHVIEDAAHAIGAEYKGRKIGTIGNLTCFSFYVTKNMTTAEGGAITTDDDECAARIKVLRLHGMSADAWSRYSSKGNWYYEIDECGWKYNMTDINAALGLHQIKKLDGFIDLRRKLAAIYNKGLGKLKGTIIPYEAPDVKHVYHIYPLLLEAFDRGEFIRKMNERGIACSVHFIPLHLHPFYKRRFGFRKGEFINTEWVYEREVSLPLYPKMTEKDISDVISAAGEVLQ